MIQSNPIRKEEFLRKWLEALEIPIEKETKNQSAAQIKKIDFAKTMVEAEDAEKKLQRELEKRNKVMAELQRQAASNAYDRGSYE